MGRHGARVIAVAAAGLTKRFDAHAVFDGLDLTVAERETLAILGPSGSGKSTLLRCIAGLTPLDGGSIAVNGEVGFVFQEPRLFPWLNVEENVRFAARDATERARVSEVIELVGLGPAAKRLPKALSGGMAQRAGLARALVRNPKILLLDEPLASLDALKRLELQAAVRDIVRLTHATAIVVTHDIDEALYLADRAIVLGGAPSRVVLSQVRNGVPPIDRSELLRALGVTLEERAGGDLAALR
jgi:sulfonate transport system ATP-binding protein